MANDIDVIDRIEGPRSATDQAAHRIRDAILSGRLAPGTQLPETRLAEQLGVSRIPIREALSRLEAEGLIKRVPYRVAEVVGLSADQVAEFYMLRSLLEGFAAKLATSKMSREDLAKLRRLISRIDECIDAGRHDELNELHHEFHSTIYSQCGSAKLISWIEELYNRFPRNLRRSFRHKEPVHEYSRIVDALEAKDAELAGKLMSEHLLNGSLATTEHYAKLLSGAGEARASLELDLL